MSSEAGFRSKNSLAGCQPQPEPVGPLRIAVPEIAEKRCVLNRGGFIGGLLL